MRLLIVAICLTVALGVAIMAATPKPPVKKLGPVCTKLCDMDVNNTDGEKWEAQCQSCCDEMKRSRSACYATCAKYQVPEGVDCKKRTHDPTVDPCGCK